MNTSLIAILVTMVICTVCATVDKVLEDKNHSKKRLKDIMWSTWAAEDTQLSSAHESNNLDIKVLAAANKYTDAQLARMLASELERYKNEAVEARNLYNKLVEDL